MTDKPKPRSVMQNALFHKQIGDIAKQLRHHGQLLDAEDWKRLLMNAFRYDTKDDPDLRDEWVKVNALRLMPALNNPGFVAVGDNSRYLSVVLASAFVEWLYAFGSEQNVRFSAPAYMMEA